ncbi:MAG: hypothetical protein CVV64_10135 [Candidatus Wallbacteria bacterium HGW-Wallbacteria-1]|jgi:hypothetical protein|uniref:SSD domain-containing protein n=1 Tax=Candidatus Wallbacteria bacterium HGW-Wallbacteria-1 TaxID=2013854 RepID=A0A2N1PPQ5_9BACT|nr:MAG: hypothetical protein CVV64_10135 [Candidatus Wallbacteria bacterium HGW-Wallbacteria-1]
MRLILDRPGIWIAIICGAVILLLPFAGKHGIDNRLEENVLGGKELTTYRSFISEFGNDRILIGGFRYTSLNGALVTALFELEEALMSLEGVQEVMSPVTTLRKVFNLKPGQELQNWVKSENRVSNYFSRLTGFSIARNVIINTEKSTAAIIIRLKSEVADTDTKIISRIRETAENHPYFKNNIQVTGIPDIVRVLHDYTEYSRKVFTPATLIVIILVLIFLYPSISGVMIPLAVILTPLISTMGIFNLAGNDTNFITAMIPPLILGLGLTSCIHVMTAYIQKSGGECKFNPEILLDVLRDQTPPILMCQVTTIFGFATLATNGLGAIRQYGIYSALGVCLVIVSVLVLLPALMAATGFRHTGKTPAPVSRSLFPALSGFVIARPRLIITLSIATLLAGLYGVSKTSMETSLIRYLPHDHPVTKRINTIEEGLCGIVPVHLTLDVRGEQDLLDPDYCKAISRMQKKISAISGAGSVISYVNMITDYDMAFSGEDENIPPSRDEIVEYLEFYRPYAASEITEEIIRNPDGTTKEIILHETTALQDTTGTSDTSSDMVESFLSSDFRRAHVTIRLKDVSSSELTSIFNRIRSIARNTLPGDIKTELTGRAYLWAEASEALVHNEAINFLWSLLLIDLVIIWRFRSLIIGIAALLPNLLPLGIIYGLMGYWTVPVNTVTGMLACVAIGMSVDDTIHFTHSMQKKIESGMDYPQAIEKSLEDKGLPMIFTTLVIMCGFGVLMLSEFVPTFQFGALICLTFMMALLLDLTLTPAILLVAKPFKVSTQGDVSVPPEDSDLKHAVSAENINCGIK